MLELNSGTMYIAYDKHPQSKQKFFFKVIAVVLLTLLVVGVVGYAAYIGGMFVGVVLSVVIAKIIGTVVAIPVFITMWAIAGLAIFGFAMWFALHAIIIPTIDWARNIETVWVVD